METKDFLRIIVLIQCVQNFSVFRSYFNQKLQNFNSTKKEEKNFLLHFLASKAFSLIRNVLSLKLYKSFLYFKVIIYNHEFQKLTTLFSFIIFKVTFKIWTFFLIEWQIQNASTLHKSALPTCVRENAHIKIYVDILIQCLKQQKLSDFSSGHYQFEEKAPFLQMFPESDPLRRPCLSQLLMSLLEIFCSDNWSQLSLNFWVQEKL